MTNYNSEQLTNLHFALVCLDVAYDLIEDVKCEIKPDDDGIKHLQDAMYSINRAIIRTRYSAITSPACVDDDIRDLFN